MTGTSYYLAWIIYLLAAFCLNVIAWKLSANWKNIIWRHTAIAASLIVALTPYYSDAEQGRMAPAILISLFEFVFGEKETALHAATPLLALLLLVLLISFVFNLSKKYAK